MHPLHDYVAKQLAEHLKARHVVVWYDARRDFAPFITELRGASTPAAGVATVTAAGATAKLVEFNGSFFELRALIEPLTSGDAPERVVVYLPGVDREPRSSVLMEAELAGERYAPELKKVARNVLRATYTDGQIDEVVGAPSVGYDDLARAASRRSIDPPSVLKTIFSDTPETDQLLATWLANDKRDAEVVAKGATIELAKLVLSRLGLTLPSDQPLAKLRAATLRYVLAGEFRLDLTCPPPASLDAVPTSPDGFEPAVRALAVHLRTSFTDSYEKLADQVERELDLSHARLPADGLGAVDTFRFEERALLDHCGALITAHRFDDAQRLINEREHSFWLARDYARKAQWDAFRSMATLGTACVGVRAAVAKAGTDPGAWVDAYTAQGGWHRVDQAQRRLEVFIAKLDDEPSEQPLGVVRRLYDDVCHAMAEGFTRALANGQWTVPNTLHQTKIFSEVVAARPKPVAYFFVDAMRFEMGLDLIDRLPKSAEISARPAVAVLPSITPLGMAALLPGAAASYTVVEDKGRLGARIDDAFLPDLGARKKHAASRVPNLVDLSLDDLLSLQASKLAKKVEGAQVVVVRSQEIDHAGEAGFNFHARQVMDTVIDNLARAIRKLAAAGVEHSVVTADHGHLFFPTDRDESMRTDSPGGDKVELHRRCWIGRGGSTPPGCVRIAAATLGYASDLEFVFPVGSGVFKAGGNLAFHHGGPSLQELIVPVLSIRLKVRESIPPAATAVTVTGIPSAITNRMVTFAVSSLFGCTFVPVLLFKGRKVGGVFGAVGAADVKRDAGTVTLPAGASATLAMLLADDSVTDLRIALLDPTTDAELYRSPADLPVRLST